MVEKNARLIRRCCLSHPIRSVQLLARNFRRRLLLWKSSGVTQRTHWARFPVLYLDSRIRDEDGLRSTVPWWHLCLRKHRPLGHGLPDYSNLVIQHQTVVSISRHLMSVALRPLRRTQSRPTEITTLHAPLRLAQPGAADIETLVFSVGQVSSVAPLSLSSNGAQMALLYILSLLLPSHLIRISQKEKLPDQIRNGCSKGHLFASKWLMAWKWCSSPRKLPHGSPVDMCSRAQNLWEMWNDQ